MTYPSQHRLDRIFIRQVQLPTIVAGVRLECHHVLSISGHAPLFSQCLAISFILSSITHLDFYILPSCLL